LVVEVTPRVRAIYEERVEAASTALKYRCGDRGVTYLRAATDVAPLDFLFGAARDARVVSL